MVGFDWVNCGVLVIQIFSSLSPMREGIDKKSKWTSYESQHFETNDFRAIWANSTEFPVGFSSTLTNQ